MKKGEIALFCWQLFFKRIRYIKANYYEQNYIKIIYYIDKVKNESFSELYYKAYYLVYIIDFIRDTKNGSLYDLLNNSTECAKCNVKSIEADYEVILKSKIKFGFDEDIL